jgi:hypothetical protein
MEILAKALGDSPSREDARLPFFRAAIAVPQDELALASIEHLLQRKVLGQLAPDRSRDEEIISAEEDSDTGEGGAMTPSNLTLQPSQQAQLAFEVALAMLRLERLDESAQFLQIAQKLEKSPDKRITSQLLDIRARLRRQRTNAARQPILHAALEQDRLVRPRLMARAAPAKPRGKAGGKS